jgi:hypothetical protein
MVFLWINYLIYQSYLKIIPLYKKKDSVWTEVNLDKRFNVLTNIKKIQKNNFYCSCSGAEYCMVKLSLAYMHFQFHIIIQNGS